MTDDTDDAIERLSDSIHKAKTDSEELAAWRYWADIHRTDPRTTASDLRLAIDEHLKAAMEAGELREQLAKAHVDLDSLSGIAAWLDSYCGRFKGETYGDALRRWENKRDDRIEMQRRTIVELEAERSRLEAALAKRSDALVSVQGGLASASKELAAIAEAIGHEGAEDLAEAVRAKVLAANENIPLRLGLAMVSIARVQGADDAHLTYYLAGIERYAEQIVAKPLPKIGPVKVMPERDGADGLIEHVIELMTCSQAGCVSAEATIRRHIGDAAADDQRVPSVDEFVVIAAAHFKDNADALAKIREHFARDAAAHPGHYGGDPSSWPLDDLVSGVRDTIDGIRNRDETIGGLRRKISACGDMLAEAGCLDTKHGLEEHLRRFIDDTNEQQAAVIAAAAAVGVSVDDPREAALAMAEKLMKRREEAKAVTKLIDEAGIPEGSHFHRAECAVARLRAVGVLGDDRAAQEQVMKIHTAMQCHREGWSPEKILGMATEIERLKVLLDDAVSDAKSQRGTLALIDDVIDPLYDDADFEEADLVDRANLAATELVNARRFLAAVHPTAARPDAEGLAGPWTSVLAEVMGLRASAAKRPEAGPAKGADRLLAEAILVLAPYVGASLVGPHAEVAERAIVGITDAISALASTPDRG